MANEEFNKQVEEVANLIANEDLEGATDKVNNLMSTTDDPKAMEDIVNAAIEIANDKYKQGS